MEEGGLGILRVERAAAHVAAARSADDHRAREKGAVPRRGDVVGEDAVGAGDEVDELHLADRPHAHVRRAGRRADEAGLADRRVDHPLGAEPVEQAIGHLERAAVASDVLAQAEDVRVALHLLEQRLADRLEVGDLSHRGSPSSRAARASPPRGARPRGTRAPASRGGSAYTPSSASQRLGEGRGLGLVGGPVDLGLHPVVDGGQLVGTDALALRQRLHVAVERIVLPSPALDLAGGHVRLVVVLRVALPPVRHELEQRHALAAPRPVHRVPGDPIHLEHVVAVGANAGDAVACRLVGQPLGRALLVGGGGVGVAVVLHHDHERAALHRGEVDPLVKGAGGGRPVAHVHQADPRLLPHPKRERDAGHDRDHVAQMRDLPHEVAVHHVAEVDVELPAAGG